MNIRKWIAVLTGAAVTVCTSSAFKMMEEVYAENASDAYRIMCVGDSITHGYINGDNGYRKYLCHYLAQDGISYDMVGPENNWTDLVDYNWNGTSITYDPAHCGYSGYAIRQYNGRNGIYETMFSNANVMQTYNPDVVLLQIGTNDLLDARLDIVNNTGDITAELSAVERLEGLVDEIILNMDASDMLFIASVPYIDAEIRSDWLYAYSYILGVDTNNTAQLQEKVNDCVDRYNSGVKALADRKSAEGYNVYFADINSVVDMKAGLEDGVHPNESGYAEMGKLWANTLSSYLGKDTPSYTTITETTTTTTDQTTTTSTTTETTSDTTTTSETTLTETTTFLTSESFVITETTTSSEEIITTTTTEQQIQENLPGDANGNGSIELADAVLLRKYLLGMDGLNSIIITNCDMDSNAKVNIFDAVILLGIMTGKPI